MKIIIDRNASKIMQKFKKTMTRNYYTRNKLTQIIMDLIYLSWEMRKEGNVDRFSLKGIDEAIDILKYYLQFLTKDNND